MNWTTNFSKENIINITDWMIVLNLWKEDFLKRFYIQKSEATEACCVFGNMSCSELTFDTENQLQFDSQFTSRLILVLQIQWFTWFLHWQSVLVPKNGLKSCHKNVTQNVTFCPLRLVKETTTKIGVYGQMNSVIKFSTWNLVKLYWTSLAANQVILLVFGLEVQIFDFLSHFLSHFCRISCTNQFKGLFVWKYRFVLDFNMVQLVWVVVYNPKLDQSNGFKMSIG